MLRQSFIFLDKVGETSERKIWEQGIHSWEDFLSAKDISHITGARKAVYSMQIKKAEDSLDKEDYGYFAGAMPKGQLFRLYPHLRDEAVFLDIETSGYYGDITVIGLYDGENVMSLVRGFNLDKDILQKALDRYKMIITFNGSSFDLPVIKRYFDIDMPQVHMDLRHVCHKVGLDGGLKLIEKKTGITRSDELKDVTGEEAVMLWNYWKNTGDRKYLDLLVKYNEADIVNLKPLADRCVKELWHKVRNSH